MQDIVVLVPAPLPCTSLMQPELGSLSGSEPYLRDARWHGRWHGCWRCSCPSRQCQTSNCSKWPSNYSGTQLTSDKGLDAQSQLRDFFIFPATWCSMAPGDSANEPAGPRVVLWPGGRVINGTNRRYFLVPFAYLN